VRLFAPRTSAAAAFAGVEKPAGTSPWREARWCALDLELTGLDPRKNDIIAVGAVPIEDGCVLLGESLYTLVRSSQRSEHGAVLVHKLRVADLAAAPTLEEAIELVLEVLTGRIPVFHTGAVERSFLGPLFAKRRVRLPAAADTEVLGRLWLRERDGVAPNWLSLGKLSAILKQPEEAPHHALGDAVTTAKAFVALASHLDAVEPQTVSSLVRAEDRMRVARRLG
jgi:DNA polymerase III subunit epsilon